MAWLWAVVIAEAILIFVLWSKIEAQAAGVLAAIEILGRATDNATRDLADLRSRLDRIESHI